MSHIHLSQRPTVSVANRFGWIGLPLACALALCTTASGEDPSTAPSADYADWQRLYATLARQWRAEVSDGELRTLELQPEPVLNWSSLNDYNGSLFAWTDAGRPALIGCVFSFTRDDSATTRYVVTEFQSLSEQVVDLTDTNGTAISLTPIPDSHALPKAPAVPDSPSQRRLQSRRIAERFSGVMHRGDDEWDFRLLPKPLLEFTADAADQRSIRSRALFAHVCFVTDPEALLLIDALETDQGAQWVYRTLRFSNKRLVYSLDGDMIWDAAALDSAGTTDAGYASVPGARTFTVEQLHQLVSEATETSKSQ